MNKPMLKIIFNCLKSALDHSLKPNDLCWNSQNFNYVSWNGQLFIYGQIFIRFFSDKDYFGPEC